MISWRGSRRDSAPFLYAPLETYFKRVLRYFHLLKGYGHVLCYSNPVLVTLSNSEKTFDDHGPNLIWDEPHNFLYSFSFLFFILLLLLT